MNKPHDRILADIKKEFYTYRNGIVADALRKQGSPYKFIFGLNLPQLTEIAAHLEQSVEFAKLMLNNYTTRESQILASLILPKGIVDLRFALEWISKCKSQEAIDIFCLKQLSDKNLISKITDECCNSESDLMRYAALRLMFKILPDNTQYAKQYAAKELTKNNQLTRLAAMQLINEISFIEEED